MNRLVRVLVVDDDIDSAELMADSLRLNGLDVAVAHNAIAALDVVRAFAPMVALLDIGMPGMNGYELARQLIASGYAVRLIAVTGYGRNEDRARAVEAGFEAHFVKPVTTAAILATIASFTQVRPASDTPPTGAATVPRPRQSTPTPSRPVAADPSRAR